MEENKESNLDAEYKRYLQIMRPYLGQLLDQDAIEICKAWIQRLSKCKRSEKNVRNKYVFTLCYQLAKGFLDEPFIRYPSDNELSPLCDELDSDESSTEVECLVINPDNIHTRVIYNNLRTPHTVTENITESECLENVSYNSTVLMDGNNFDNLNIKKSLLCCNSQELIVNKSNPDKKNDELEDRANNVILKLRQIKNENLMLHKELNALKCMSKRSTDHCVAEQNIHKIDIATSAYIRAPESNTALNSLKSKLQEIQNSRDMLIETISNLQDTLDNFNELKRHEINELQAKHKLEIIKTKTNVKEDVLKANENQIEDVKRQHENIIKNIQFKHKNEIETLKVNMDGIIFDKDKLLQCKDMEILRLNGLIDDLKSQCTKENNNKILTDSNFNSENCNILEKRLRKMEKIKNRNARIYEVKIANLQREKHLIECSLQLQLIKQRAQVVEEVTNESQTELTTALEKLEAKYKEITANVQTTAVQRRIQDQMALESIIKTICDIPNEGYTFNTQIQNERPLLMNNLNKRTEQASNYGKSSFSQNNKFGHVIIGNKSFKEENEGNNSGYINKDTFSDLFEKGHIPQKEFNNVSVNIKN